MLNKLESFTTSKTDRHLLCQKVHDKKLVNISDEFITCTVDSGNSELGFDTNFVY